MALLTLACGALHLGADDGRPDLTELLRPARIENVTLSPDGRRIAFTQREGTVLSIAIREIDAPRRTLIVRADVDETVGFVFRRVAFSVRVPFLHWATDNALVYTISLPTNDQLVRDEVHVVDANGNNDRKLADPDLLDADYTPPDMTPMPSGTQSFADLPPTEPSMGVSVPRRPVVVGFDAENPELVLVEATGDWRVSRETFAINLRTGERTRTDQEDSEGRFLYDAHGVARVHENPRVRIERPPPRVPGFHAAPLPPAGPRVVSQYYDVRRDRSWERIDRIVHGVDLHFRVKDEEYYAPRSFPLAVDADGAKLYYASDVGRDTVAIGELDLKTGTCAILGENDDHDLADRADVFSKRALVFDRRRRLAGVRVASNTRWFDRTLASVDRAVRERFPNRVVELLEWSESKERVLAFVSGPDDPGRYYLVESGPNAGVTELLRRLRKAPAELGRTRRFTVTAPDGRTVTGTVTLPPWSRVQPPPLVVRCRDLPRAVVPDRFNAEDQVLAALGYEVLDVEYRGVDGWGRRHREGIAAGLERAPLEDIRVAWAWVREHHPFDGRRVAWLGEGFGGYLALRAAAEMPCRCVVAINAPTDLDDWVMGVMVMPNPSGVMRAQTVPSLPTAIRRAYFAPFEKQLGMFSVIRHAEQLRQPVLLVHDTERFETPVRHAEQLRDALKRLGRSPQLMTISTRGGDTTAKVFTRIGDFLNDELFRYRVDIGKEEVVK